MAEAGASMLYDKKGLAFGCVSGTGRFGPSSVYIPLPLKEVLG